MACKCDPRGHTVWHSLPLRRCLHGPGHRVTRGKGAGAAFTRPAHSCLRHVLQKPWGRAGAVTDAARARACCS